MSGISRFFAPVKCTDAKTDATTNDGHPKKENEDGYGSKNESGMAVNGIELDKDGWQIFPQNVASTAGGDGAIVCIDIGDSEEEDEAEGDQPKVDAKEQAQITVPMPEILAKSEVAPENQGETTSAQDTTVKESDTNDNVGLRVVRDIAKNKGTVECESNAEVHAKNNADEANIGINSNGTNADATISSASEMNPFASFAFSSGDIPPVARRNDTFKRPSSTLDVPTKERSIGKNGGKKISQGKQKDNKKRRRTSAKKKGDSNDYVPVCQLSKEQQEEIRAKWQSLGDPNESLEVRRFQVLVAARLHAQSREPIVRAAMENLRNFFSERENAVDGGALSAKNLSRADPKKLQSKSLRFCLPMSRPNISSRLQKRYAVDLVELSLKGRMVLRKLLALVPNLQIFWSLRIVTKLTRKHKSNF